MGALDRINPGEFVNKAYFKRREASRTATGEVKKEYVDAGMAYVKIQQKTIGEGVDDTKIALSSVVELTTYILTGVDNTYRVVLSGREYEILSVVPVRRQYMLITAKLR